jgi:hypothetical protein
MYVAGKSAPGGGRGGRRGRLPGRPKGRRAAAKGPLSFLGISPKIGNIALNLVGMFRPPGLGNLQGCVPLCDIHPALITYPTLP